MRGGQHGGGGGGEQERKRKQEGETGTGLLTERAGIKRCIFLLPLLSSLSSGQLPAALPLSAAFLLCLTQWEDR